MTYKITKAVEKEMAKHQFGKISSVPMGNILPHAIRVESFFTYIGPDLDDHLRQLVVVGQIVEKVGHSQSRMGEEVKFSIYWQM